MKMLETAYFALNCPFVKTERKRTPLQTYKQLTKMPRALVLPSQHVYKTMRNNQHVVYQCKTGTRIILYLHAHYDGKLETKQFLHFHKVPIVEAFSL